MLASFPAVATLQFDHLQYPDAVFVYTATNQKLDGGEAWELGYNEVRSLKSGECKMKFWSVFSGVNSF